MQLQILGSSSSGNCALIQTPESKVLIDAGFSARRIRSFLAQAGHSLESINAVFITHEHGDHTMGLDGLTKLPGLKVYANRPTIEVLHHRMTRPVVWKAFQTGSTFRFQDLQVTSFSIPHDATDPVGFIFQTGGHSPEAPRRRLAWATDLGYASERVLQQIADADFLVLESNHDPLLLERSGRPWSTRQRIASRHGHLSNKAALDLLTSAATARWKKIRLAHISRECNDLGLIREMFAQLASERGWDLAALDPSRCVHPPESVDP